MPIAPIARRVAHVLTTVASLKSSKETMLLKQRANALLTLVQSPSCTSPFSLRVWPRIKYCAVVHSPQGAVDNVVRIIPFSADRKRIIWTCEALHAVATGRHEKQERRLLPVRTQLSGLSGTDGESCPDGTAHVAREHCLNLPHHRI